MGFTSRAVDATGGGDDGGSGIDVGKKCHVRRAGMKGGSTEGRNLSESRIVGCITRFRLLANHCGHTPVLPLLAVSSTQSLGALRPNCFGSYSPFKQVHRQIVNYLSPLRYQFDWRHLNL
jgi:hypothetical protein